MGGGGGGGVLNGGPNVALICNVKCLCQLFPLYHTSHLRKGRVPYRYIFAPFSMSLNPMSHVEFEKYPCRPVSFRGQGACHVSRGCISCPGLHPYQQVNGIVSFCMYNWWNERPPSRGNSLHVLSL